LVDCCGLLRFDHNAIGEHFQNIFLILPETREAIRR
jgi:hypothetical protein